MTSRLVSGRWSRPAAFAASRSSHAMTTFSRPIARSEGLTVARFTRFGFLGRFGCFSDVFCSAANQLLRGGIVGAFGACSSNRVSMRRPRSSTPHRNSSIMVRRRTERLERPQQGERLWKFGAGAALAAGGADGLLAAALRAALNFFQRSALRVGAQRARSWKPQLCAAATEHAPRFHPPRHRRPRWSPPRGARSCPRGPPRWGVAALQTPSQPSRTARACCGT